ncbi:MAG TPA: peptidylprolyl isomerase [Candidatus Cloacimonadota bacterium]|nr:peptidylprolyl isomerase [Candidatus Cloacimonadota bacterium]
MKKYLFLLLVLVALILSCKKEKDESPILAQVGEEVLTEAAFNSLFSKAELDSLSTETRRKYIEDWVNLTVLAQEADQQKLSETPALRARMEFARKKVKANALIGQRLASIRVSEDELFNYFRIHQGEFEANLKEYSLQRIMINDKTTAELILGRLASGLAFEEAVRNYSLEELKNSGGMMGWVAKAGPDSSFWNAANGLALNTPSLYNQGLNWYVFRIVEERLGTEEANFEDYKTEIRHRIIAEKEEQVYLDLVRELKARTDKIYYY